MSFEYIKPFKNLFKGNDSFYGENLLSDTKQNGKGKMESAFSFKNQQLSENEYLMHLEGKKGLAICPITNDNKCTFGMIDIDCYNTSYKGLIDYIYNNSIPLTPFRSKSGGLHLYLFLKGQVEARVIITALKKFVTSFGLSSAYRQGNVSKVEIFPKQALLTEDTKGNVITLPLYGGDETVQYLITAGKTKLSLIDTLNFCAGRVTSIKHFEDSFKTIPYLDAPKCLQTITTLNLMTENGGRNNYLFSMAVYLKKKYGDDFGSYLEEINHRMLEPIEEKELQTIIKSVKVKEYFYRCGEIPCQDFCDKKECARREFGIGRDKGHFPDVEYGKMYRMRAKDPYYVWELKRIGDTGDFKTVMFKDAQKLLEQRTFAKVCVDFLNFAPIQINDNDWRAILNDALSNIEDKIVTEESDTSDTAFLIRYFKDFLTERQTVNSQPFHIYIGNVYLDDSGYYFSMDAVHKYLVSNRVPMKDVNLREALLDYGCTETVLIYKNKQGLERQVKCFFKKNDTILQALADTQEALKEVDEDIISAMGRSKEDEEDSF